MIDFSFPENRDPEDNGDRPPEPPPQPKPSPWRADLLILLAASAATVVTFLFEAWQDTRSDTVVKSAPAPEITQARPPG